MKFYRHIEYCCQESNHGPLILTGNVITVMLAGPAAKTSNLITRESFVQLERLHTNCSKKPQI